MTTRAVEPWMRIDRGELLSECALLIPDGGLLVVEGDNLSGRNEAAWIAVSFFEDSGLRTHHVPDAGTRPSSVRYLLESVSAWVVSEIGATEGGLSVLASNASVSLDRLSKYCVQALERLKQTTQSDFAFVITALGQSGPMDRREVEVLGRLIESIGGCWIVITQEGARWGHLSPKILRLRMFTRAEVANTIREIITARGGDLGQVAGYVNVIFEDGCTQVNPIYAYYYVQQLAAAQ